MLPLPRYARAALSSAIRVMPIPLWRQRRLAEQIHTAFPPTEDTAICTTKMQLGYRMILDLRSVYTEWETYYSGDYDTSVIRSITKLVKPGSIVLDVGANIGFWTVPLAQAAGSSGVVHSFEPLPSNHARLLRNISLNGMDGIVRPHKLGLSDCEATLSLSMQEDFANGSSTGNAAIVIDDSDNVFKNVPIQVRTLDSIRTELSIDRIDLMKVDIEGHEDKFLAGAAESIARLRPLIYIEVNEPYYTRRGLDVTEVFDSWIKRAGYDSVFHRDGKWIPLPISARRGIIDNALLVPNGQLPSILTQLN